MRVCRAEIPPGFDVVEDGRLHFVVRREVRLELEPLLRQWSSGVAPAGRRLAGGRGGVVAIDRTPELSLVVRPCRRGGLVARFNSDLHFGLKPRPLREIRIGERLRDSGVPTAELLGAAVHWLFPGCYRGVVVSREVRGALNLWEYIRSIEVGKRVEVCKRVAAVTRQLHDAGVIHPDLNLQNYLIGSESGELEVLIIDCDRARLRVASVHDRSAAFTRVCRSVRRLDPRSTVITPACIEALRGMV